MIARLTVRCSHRASSAASWPVRYGLLLTSNYRARRSVLLELLDRQIGQIRKGPLNVAPVADGTASALARSARLRRPMYADVYGAPDGETVCEAARSAVKQVRMSRSSASLRWERLASSRPWSEPSGRRPSNRRGFVVTIARQGGWLCPESSHERSALCFRAGGCFRRASVHHNDDDRDEQQAKRTPAANRRIHGVLGHRAATALRRI